MRTSNRCGDARLLFRRVIGMLLAAALLLIGEPLRAQDVVKIRPETVYFAMFAPDGQHVLIGRYGGAIDVRRVPKGTLEATLRTCEGNSDAALSPDGRFLAVPDAEDGAATIRLWNTATWKPGERIRVKDKKFFGVAFSPNSEFLAMGTGDGEVILWDIKKRAVHKSLQGRGTNGGAIQRIVFAPGDWQMACAGGGREVDVWFTDRFQQPVQGFFHGDSLRVRALAYSREGLYLLTGGDDKAARVFHCYSFEEVQTFRGHKESVLAIVPLTGEKIISGSHDHSMRVWDIRNGREDSVLQLESDVKALSLSPDRKTLMSVESDTRGGGIRFWDVPSLLRAHGDVKPEECQKWQTEWKPAPAQPFPQKTNVPAKPTSKTATLKAPNKNGTAKGEKDDGSK